MSMLVDYTRVDIELTSGLQIALTPPAIAVVQSPFCNDRHAW